MATVYDPDRPGRNPYSLQGVNVVQATQNYVDRNGALPANISSKFPVTLDAGGRVQDDRSWMQRNNWWAIPASVVGGAVAAPYVAGALAGGGGAGASASAMGTAAAGSGAAAGAAGAAGAGTVAASGLPWGHIISGVAGVTTSAMGNRAQSNAAREAAGVTERTTNAQLAWARENAAAEAAREEARERAERERWDAQQLWQQRQWDAEQEERAWARRIEEEDRAYQLSERQRVADERMAREAARNQAGAYDPNYQAQADAEAAARAARYAPYNALRLGAQQNLGSLLAMPTPGYRPATAPLPPVVPGSLGSLLRG